MAFIILKHLIGFHKSRYDHYDDFVGHPDALSFNFLQSVEESGRHAKLGGVRDTHLQASEFCVVVACG